MEYNLAQKEAIQHKEGPCLVLAGPGSGKTAVLCERLLELTEAGIAADEILVITFTKAAAKEMKERFLKRVQKKEACNRITFGTFHAVFFAILKQAYGFRADSIIREGEKLALLEDLLARLPAEIEADEDFKKELLNEFSALKNSGGRLSLYEPRSLSPEHFQSIYRDYSRILKERKKIDFDDMLLLTRELFRRSPELLRAWQKRFSYLLVDEFQDINPLQFEVVKQLALPQNNLFVVGDDDQSIYAFRGSRPQIMLDFPKVYPDCKQILLNVNYRSKENIVRNACALIESNKERFRKEIQAEQKEDGSCQIWTFEDTLEEADCIARYLKEHPQESAAILVRSNSQMSVFAAKLTQEGVAFQATEDYLNPFRHWMIEDLFAYFALGDAANKGANPAFTRKDLLRVMNRPNRYIMRNAVEKEFVHTTDLLRYYAGNERMTQRLQEFFGDLLFLGTVPTYAAINYLRGAVEYESYLTEYGKKRGESEGSYREILDILQEHSRRYPKKEDWREALKLAAEQYEKAKKKEPGADEAAVKLLTMHSSKGLEFDTVFVADCIESITPFRRALLPNEIEEERRLFYVAMTRAKKDLFLCLPKNYRNHTAHPSRFLAESQVMTSK